MIDMLNFQTVENPIGITALGTNFFFFIFGNLFTGLTCNNSVVKNREVFKNLEKKKLIAMIH